MAGDTIYLRACERIGLEPSQVVFLDDIGRSKHLIVSTKTPTSLTLPSPMIRNLKAARKLGMQTVKVSLRDSTGKNALEELNTLLHPSQRVALDTAASAPDTKRAVRMLSGGLPSRL